MVNYHKVTLEKKRKSHRQERSFQQKTMVNRRFTMYAGRARSAAQMSAEVRICIPRTRLMT